MELMKEVQALKYFDRKLKLKCYCALIRHRLKKKIEQKPVVVPENTSQHKEN